MITLTSLRAEAEAIARQLPSLSLQAAAADVMHPGAAGRKRAGSGEQFWQYRHYAQTDAADRIDWRRSARGNDYFVRETEMETARTIYLWSDPHGGFDWTGGADTPTKADRAKVIMLGVASLLSKSGERIGVLGGGRPPALGKAATARVAEDLLLNPPPFTGEVPEGRRGEAASALSDSPPLRPAPQATSPASRGGYIEAPKSSGMLIIASDFYDPIDTWQARLAPLTAKCRHGVLVQITDPIENTFPYKGRTRFTRPGGALDRIFGRAETVRDDYLSRFAAQQDAVDKLALSMGWASVRHRTDQPAISGAAALQLALQGFGAEA